MRRLKRRVYAIISKPEAGDRVSQAFDILIVALIALSVLLIILQSFDSLQARYGRFFDAFEIFTVVVFTLEYLARLWTADLAYPQAKHPHLHYVVSGMALIDLLAILPFYLPFTGLDLRFLRMVRLIRITRMLRLLRVAKLARYVDSVRLIAQVLREVKSQLMMTVALCLGVLLFSAILMYSVENPSQPEAFPNIPAALWWAVCTLTTVGYGDVYPITAIGKTIASLLAIVGIGIIAIPTGIISAGFMRIVQHEKPEESAPAAPNYCPHCGKKLSQ